MPLDWLNTPLDADIGDLIARKKRAKTIELLRSQLQGRMVPPVQMRLQLADLLVQAGREAEAVPILIGLADEFAGDGFVAKAIAILKRVDKVQPGRADVESRMASLVKLQREAPPPSPRSRRTPEFGIEEIRDEEAAPAPEAPVRVELPPLPAEPPPVPIEPPPIPSVEAPRPPSGETDTTRRVRGVFRRFLASLPGTGSSPEPGASPPPAPATEPAAAAAATTASATSEVGVTPTAEAVPSEDTLPHAETFESAEDTRPDTETAEARDETIPDTEAAAPADFTAPDSAVEEPDATVVDAAAIEVDEPELVEADEADDEDTVPDAATTDSAAAMDAAPTAAAEPGTEAAGVAGRIRGALKWLVSSLGTGEQGAATGPPEPIASQAEAGVSATGASASTAAAADAAASAEAGDEEPMSDEVFQERLLDLAQDILRRPGAERAPREAPPMDRGLVLRYAQRLLATALFGDLSEEELLAVVRGLRLHLHGPGDVMVTEGERGQSIFVLASGSAKVFVRSPSGRNFPVAELREGEFFGEISSLSGRPRSATVTASARCELLELDRPTMDEIARSHPRVADVLEEYYIRRASSPEAAAVRAVPMNDAGAERKAIEVLEAHFGQSRWDPRMRLRLADVLLKAGKYEDAVPVLIGLADDLARAGFPEKAIAVLKKIEKIRRRDIEVVNLAPLAGGAPPPERGPRRRAARVVTAAPTAAKPSWSPQATAEFFQGWLVDVLRDRVKGTESAEGDRAAGEPSRLGSIRGYGPGLSASPLFEDFTDDELLAVIRGLKLLSFDTGDIIITEGEPGQSLFVLTTGTVKVFVKDPEGRNVALVPLGEGAFFGEIATLSGRPRSATVTAASRCELLELDKTALEAILKVHPRVRDVLEEHYIARANDPEAAAIRGTKP
jgi:CRP-like cAMP-binding protein